MFLLELVPTVCGLQLSPETAVVAEHISEHNWLYPDSAFNAKACSLSEIDNITSTGIGVEEKAMIPVGSIDFVNKVLSKQGIMLLTPTNIPEQLNKEEFLKRKISIVDSKEKIVETVKSWGDDRVFIKSDAELKADYTGVYDIYGKLPDDSRYFISELIPIVSEWRVFVLRGKILGVRNYSGNEFVVPSPAFIEECISAIGDSLPAYTLDVAVAYGGRENVVIEVHEFFSCGLYGFDHPALINMITAAYRHRKAESTRKE